MNIHYDPFWYDSPIFISVSHVVILQDIYYNFNIWNTVKAWFQSNFHVYSESKDTEVGKVSFLKQLKWALIWTSTSPCQINLVFRVTKPEF
jgi:hypothetical protein